MTAARDRRARRLSWLVLVIVVVPAAIYLLWFRPTPASAEVFAHASNVDFVGAGGLLERLAHNAVRPLRVGDEVGVDDAGEAHLRFSDWLLVRLFRDSGLAMQAMADPEAPPAADVRLNTGTVLADLTPSDIAERRVSVHTEHAEVMAVGTRFLVYYNTAAEITWVVVLEGTVIVEGAGIQIELHEGFQTWVRADKGPRRPVPAVREVVGDRFPLVDDLTNNALSDPDVLSGELAAEPPPPNRRRVVQGPVPPDDPGQPEPPVDPGQPEPPDDPGQPRPPGDPGAPGGQNNPTTQEEPDEPAEPDEEGQPTGRDTTKKSERNRPTPSEPPTIQTEPGYTLTVTVVGDGAVTGSGIDCGQVCSTAIEAGRAIELAAKADAGSALSGWSIPACGTQSTCSVTMTSDQRVTATFEVDQVELTVKAKPEGSGTVTVDGGDCSSPCVIPRGAEVELIATPSTNHVWVGWSGDLCENADGSHERTCTVTVASNMTVTANFVLLR